jgi:hypothetical protein
MFFMTNISHFICRFVFIWEVPHSKSYITIRSNFNVDYYCTTVPAKGYATTNSMAPVPPWEANSHSTTPDIHRLLWNPKVYCCFRKNLPFVPILRVRLLVQILLSFLFKFTFNTIILPSRPRSRKCFLPFRVPNQSSLFLLSDMLNTCFD